MGCTSSQPEEDPFFKAIQSGGKLPRQPPKPQTYAHRQRIILPKQNVEGGSSQAEYSSSYNNYDQEGDVQLEDVSYEESEKEANTSVRAPAGQVPFFSLADLRKKKAARDRVKSRKMIIE